MKTQRKKGKDFENQVARILRSLWPQARRGLQNRDGSEACDVEGTPFHVECKHRKEIVRIQAAYAQGVAETNGRPVIAVTRQNRGPVLVTMHLSDWLDQAELAEHGRRFRSGELVAIDKAVDRAIQELERPDVPAHDELLEELEHV